MMCFRDRSWCSSKCGNLECSRNFTEDDRKQATEWWGDETFPLSISDFRTKECGYVEVENA